MSEMSTHSTHHRADTNGRGFEEVLDVVRKPAAIAALAGVVLLLIGLFVSGPKQFFQSYLYGYLFWLGLTLGPMAVVMIQNLSGGRWGLVVRRIGEAASRNVPLMAILFIPMLFSVGYIYPWAGATPEGAEAHKHYAPFKQAWLQPEGWRLRTGIYFVVWMIIAWVLNRLSSAQDRDTDPVITRRLSLVSGPGLVFYVLAMTGAATDWIMTLDPDWYSTMFGVLFVVAQGLSSMAMFAILLHLIRDRSPMKGLVDQGIFHDIGNFMLAFTMFFTYVNFSQFLIIWSGNIAEETPYYVYSTQHGWKILGLALVLFHFFVPFLLLLWRRTKKNSNWLWKVAVLILFMRFVDLKWITGPSFDRPLVHGDIDPNNLPGFRMHWLDVVAPIAIGGIWLLAFVWQLKRKPLLAPNDPRLLPAVEAAAHAAHH